jgi:hypothetical protein
MFSDVHRLVKYQERIRYKNESGTCKDVFNQCKVFRLRSLLDREALCIETERGLQG